MVLCCDFSMFAFEEHKNESIPSEYREYSATTLHQRLPVGSISYSHHQLPSQTALAAGFADAILQIVLEWIQQQKSIVHAEEPMTPCSKATVTNSLFFRTDLKQ